MSQFTNNSLSTRLLQVLYLKGDNSCVFWIQTYFSGAKEMGTRKLTDSNDDHDAGTLASPSSHSLQPVPPLASATSLITLELDIGGYIGKNVPDALKYKFLNNTYEPSEIYDFKGDSEGARCFRHPWFSQYKPWLAYSPCQKRALCKHCVLFPQPASRGVQGAFIVRPFTKYKDFHEAARNHVASAWHRQAALSASNFLAVRKNPEFSVVCQIDMSVRKSIEENRKKLIPILSSIIFCATHDIALRGKTYNSGNLHDLRLYRIEAGDTDLADHLAHAAHNARYISVRTQNELIQLCEETLREEIVKKTNSEAGFSVIVDETADIAGKEQLSIGIRFVYSQQDNNSPIKAIIREEFLGFMSLNEVNAAAIADAILGQMSSYGLNAEKPVGQGYDGCSTMAGMEGGVI